MILDDDGRVDPNFAPRPRYRPGMHKKRTPFRIELSRLSLLKIRRGENQFAFFPGYYDAEYRFAYEAARRYRDEMGFTDRHGN